MTQWYGINIGNTYILLSTKNLITLKVYRNLTALKQYFNNYL